jgi:alkanesulfonate monooxygenase SsuD/methylene tetrahydromethanopterin reductase-like flavin-dependent oxidoreductase (luciferase family)
MYVATAGPIQAKRTGKTTDGLITVGAADDKLKMLMARFEEGAAEAGKDVKSLPKIIQFKVSFATSEDDAVAQAIKEWPNGGMAFPKGDIRNPEDFEAMPNLDEHVKQIQHYVDLGFNEIYVHNVGRNQAEFIEAYGKHVIPHVNF